MKDINWKLVKDKIFYGLVLTFSLVMVLPLVLILSYIFIKGISYINLDLFIHDQRNGGLLNAIIGSLAMVIIAALVAIPGGILCGIYLSENKTSKFAHTVRVVVDVLQGVPSIVLGIIAYAWLVLPMKRFSAFSGAIALAIMMLPVIVKNTEETLKLVPGNLKEAAYSIGAPYHKVILDIVLPAGLSGIFTGTLIAIGRILGETAPLLFTAFGSRDLTFNLMDPMEALPPLIFKYATSPDNDLVHQAWAASLILVVFILVLNIASRLAIRKLRK